MTSAIASAKTSHPYCMRSRARIGSWPDGLPVCVSVGCVDMHEGLPQSYACKPGEPLSGRDGLSFRGEGWPWCVRCEPDGVLPDRHALGATGFDEAGESEIGGLEIGNVVGPLGQERRHLRRRQATIESLE